MTQEDTPDGERLFEEALDLVIRLQDDPASPVARELVQRWRARSPAHEAAWAEVAEIHGMAGKILGDRTRAARSRRGVSRRRAILGGTVALAAVGAGALYGPALLLRARADRVTATAELRRMTLPDGSVVTLGPESALRLGFSATARRVELLAGMAFFEVVSDPARPFQTVLDELVASAQAAAFDVSRDAGYVTVAVDRGVVEVAAPAPARRERLAAGEWLTLDESARTIVRGKRDAAQIGAWREGMIVAERETIDAVVARISRWQSGRVVMADPRFGHRRISGVFDVKDPVAALAAVVDPHGGKVRQLSPWLTVISPI